MSNERPLGDHLGHLVYHIEALARRDEDLGSELATLCKEADSQDKRIKANMPDTRFQTANDIGK
jgi:hypothetical protein